MPGGSSKPVESGSSSTPPVHAGHAYKPDSSIPLGLHSSSINSPAYQAVAIHEQQEVIEKHQHQGGDVELRHLPCPPQEPPLQNFALNVYK
jgi:hypothetical protein